MNQKRREESTELYDGGCGECALPLRSAPWGRAPIGAACLVQASSLRRPPLGRCRADRICQKVGMHLVHPRLVHICVCVGAGGVDCATREQSEKIVPILGRRVPRLWRLCAQHCAWRGLAGDEFSAAVPLGTSRCELLGRLREKLAADRAVGSFEVPLPDGSVMLLPVLPFE